MKIGKTIKTVTSPKRQTQKAQPNEQPIPVDIPRPAKIPEKAEIDFRVHNWGRAMGKSVISDAAKAIMLSSITS